MRHKTDSPTIEVNSLGLGGAAIHICLGNLEFSAYLSASEYDEWREAFGHEV